MRQEIWKILEYTAIAPSSHNSQPWIVSVQDNTIFLNIDSSRKLKYSDREDRELYISLGTALQNTLYAIEGLGYNYEFSYFPKKGKELVATIKIDLSKKTPLNKKILGAMKKRHSNRNLYEDETIPEKVISNWKKIVKDLGIELNIIRDKDKKSKIAKVVSDATLEAMKDDKFRRELSMWLRHNLTKSHDGMPGFSMGVPTPVSFLSPFVIKNFNVGSQQARKEEKYINLSPILVVITGKNQTLDWVKAGQAYERVVIDAAEKNIKNSITAAAVEMGQHHKRIMEILSTHNRPLVIFRLGYCDSIPKPTPKREVQEIIK